MRNIRLTSILGASFREELERIVFFNPEQQLITNRLVDLVRRHGVPEIVEEASLLRFRVPAFGMLQTLFAVDETDGEPRLVGVVMFTRYRRGSLIVVHLAAHEDYTSRGKWAAESVIAQLINAVRAAGLRTRGVRAVRVFYPNEIRFDLRARGVKLDT